MSPDQLLAEALRLPPEMRAEIAGSLLESLDAHAPAQGVEDAWKIEVQRRAREIDRGEAATVPWEEARKRILES